MFHALKVRFDTLFVTDELLFTDVRKIANIGYQEPAGREMPTVLCNM